jgi:hypothetical protein
MKTNDAIAVKRTLKKWLINLGLISIYAGYILVFLGLFY